MVDRNQLARTAFNRKMVGKRMGNVQIVPPNKPEKELSEEEKAEIEKKKKEEEKKRKQEKTITLSKSILLKQAQIKVKQKTILRMDAQMDLLSNFSLGTANSEWEKRAIEAEIAETASIIEEMKIDLESSKKDLEKMESELDSLRTTS
jgi:hypothetical protein